MRILVVAAILAFSLVSCQSEPKRAETASAQRFGNLGTHHRAVTTDSAVAQAYFDQGLIWAFSFNHDEAIRSFKEAARLDPGCAMAWWGVAYCNGPHINNPAMTAESSAAAWEAIQQAHSLRGNASPVERALIDALVHRYADPAAGRAPLTPDERRPLDQAYAAAMKGVDKAFFSDPDVGVLYAESVMDLRPWDLWDHEGQPRPETPEVLASLEKVLRSHPNHPGACHYYIHAVEASNQPERADAGASRLRTLVPGSGHMVHMPSHIDVRLGRWPLAADQNSKAIEVHAAYRRVSPRQGFYNIYMLHNRHFLMWSCMMEGRSADAIAATRSVVAGVPKDFLDATPALADPFMIVEYDALKRFGKWDEILRLAAPRKDLPITTAHWRFTRAVALAAKGDMDAAVREQGEFRASAAAVPEGAMMSINPAAQTLAIAEHMLAGEIAYRRGEIDSAVSELTKAVEIEDSLRYMEPPDWIQPVRHTLGAVLLSAGRKDEAESVYRADLRKWPENGWALYGLSSCLVAKGSPEAADVEARFRKAWGRADISIDSTCLCVVKRQARGE